VEGVTTVCAGGTLEPHPPGMHRKQGVMLTSVVQLHRRTSCCCYVTKYLRQVTWMRPSVQLPIPMP